MIIKLVAIVTLVISGFVAANDAVTIKVALLAISGGSGKHG